MSDPAGKAAQARQKLPLQVLMEQRGRGPANGNWKKFPKCPYCSKDGAALREKGGRQWFKCHHTSCPSGTAGAKQAWDEVGFLAYELNLSRREAFKVWLKEAGVIWEAPARRGSTKRSEYLPEEEDDLPQDLPPEAREGPEIDSSPPAPPSEPGPGPTPADQTGDGSLRAQAAPAGSDGGAAVPDPPPVADGVIASPAAPAGVPTPPSGEATLFPAAEAAGTPMPTSAEPKAQDAAASAEMDGNIQHPTGGIANSQSPIANAPIAELDAVQTSAEEEKAQDGEKVPMTVTAIRWFYEGLSLAAADCDRLWRKRGILPEAAAELGLRSSLRSNEKLLLAMADLFPMNALLESHLWVRGGHASDEPRPNRFYCGLGPAGKRKNERGEEVVEFDWTHPILIPYLNREGQVMDLRTHKWTQAGQAPRLYVPRRLGSRLEREEIAYAVITEGEFKGMALWQALPRAMASALPGISMSKLLWPQIADWLLEQLPPGRPVAVVFDNEDKGTEGRPGYKAEWWKRHDTELWARYLEQRLAVEGFPARVGFLPDGWRDGNGKADWDGSLALLVEKLARV